MRHRTRIIAAVIDISAVFAITYVAVSLRSPLWPSLAITAIAYSAAATLFSANGFGFIASERLIRVIGALPQARRRLVSYRAG